MRTAVLSIAATVLVVALAAAQSARPILFEGARVIVGDGSAPIENGSFLVQHGRIAAIGPAPLSAPPAGVRVSLAGKTVMPAMINAHVHIGFEGYTTWGADNYTAANVVDHLRREAFYGTAATVSVGTNPLELALQIERDQQAGKFPPASRFLFMPGMAPPNGGPDAVLRVATNALHVVNEVSTPAEARAAVTRLAGRQIRALKIWYDDRRGTYPKLTPETYLAALDEAHKRGMAVHTHAIALADQKFVVRAGTDVLVHMVQNEKLDDEYLAILKDRRPYWATVIGLGDPTEVCKEDPFFERVLPASVIAKIRATTERRPLAPSCGAPPSNAADRESIMAYNFPRMIESGARIVLGTDTGIHPGHTFGSGEHVELARWVQLGLTPSQAIVAATKTPAELMGLKDMGTLAIGKRASFIVLDANPLDNIRNTRKISSVYLDGEKVDRDALIANFKRAEAAR